MNTSLVVPMNLRKNQATSTVAALLKPKRNNPTLVPKRTWRESAISPVRVVRILQPIRLRSRLQSRVKLTTWM